jgi:hypothetical protein
VNGRFSKKKNRSYFYFGFCPGAWLRHTGSLSIRNFSNCLKWH